MVTMVLFSTYHETDRLPANLSVSLCLKYNYMQGELEKMSLLRQALILNEMKQIDYRCA